MTDEVEAEEAPVVETERVAMLWPKELKERVRKAAGQRGMTEYIAEATTVALEGGADHLKRIEVELNSTKHLAQLLADRIVMGSDRDDRLQALMELELPSWIDTTGWPAPMAELVKVDVAEPTPPAPGDQVEVVEKVAPKTPPPAVEPEPEPGEVTASIPEVPTDVPTADLPHDRQSPSSDLLTKIQAKAKEKGVDITSAGLKPAADIPTPDPKPEPDLDGPSGLPVDDDDQADEAASNACPKCGEELIDGECWTCE